MQKMKRLLTPALTVTVARVGFAAVLLPWFLIGGFTKIAGLTLSVGPPAGAWPLSLGAYYAYLPHVMAETAIPTLWQHVFVFCMTLLEILLPIMVVAGMFGRISAGLLILHICAASLAKGQLLGPGDLFDASPFGQGPDQVVLWCLVLLPIAVHGAGPLSIDGLFARLRRRRTSPR